jgi:hypothetical protein
LSGCDTFLRVILYKKKTTLITENNKNLQRYKVLKSSLGIEGKSPKLVDDAAGERERESERWTHARPDDFLPFTFGFINNKNDSDARNFD